MDDISQRLDQNLKTAVSRLRPRGPAAVENLSAMTGDDFPFADEVDGIQASESREVGFATRELLLERVNRLSAALERIRAGDYGTCVECDDPISPARLNAAPEVETCVRCQDARERRRRVDRTPTDRRGMSAEPNGQLNQLSGESEEADESLHRRGLEAHGGAVGVAPRRR
jgi:RNA polymerase-binding transcription factor